MRPPRKHRTGHIHLGVGTVLSWWRRAGQGHGLNDDKGDASGGAHGPSLRRRFSRRAFSRGSSGLRLAKTVSSRHEGWALDEFRLRRRLRSSEVSSDYECDGGSLAQWPAVSGTTEISTLDGYSLER